MRFPERLYAIKLAMIIAAIAVAVPISAVVSFSIGYEMSAERGERPVSDVAGTQLQRDPTAVPTAAATPSLPEILRAADDLARAGLLPVAEPTPTLRDVLLAADELMSAGLIAAPQEPTLRQILVAADELVRAGIIAAPAPTLAETLVAADLLVQAGVIPAPPPARAPIEQAPPPTATPIPAPPAAPSGSGTIDAGFSQRVMELVNARRSASGLVPVVSEPRLEAASEAYASVLTAHMWFDHVGPDGSTMVDRITATGFPFDTQLGEVLAMGGDWSPEGVVQAWIDSPAHREQLLEPVYRRAGVGCAMHHDGTYLVVRCVMNFAG